MTDEYLEQMQAHLDAGGVLSHRNGLDLLAEVRRLEDQLTWEQDSHKRTQRIETPGGPFDRPGDLSIQSRLPKALAISGLHLKR